MSLLSKKQVLTQNKNVIAAAVLAGVAVVAVLFGFHGWHSRDAAAIRADMLAQLPADSTAVIFVDLAQLRSSSFLATLWRWAPQPDTDSDYKQFLQATGFHYEQDLDQLALAINNRPRSPAAFAIAEGRFDRKKIETYAAQSGALKTAEGNTLFAVPLNGSTQKAFFTFERDDRVAWANDSLFFQKRPVAPGSEWREHFSRFAGTPLFVVLRQDSAAAALLQAPGGVRSPQLAALLAQLQWISIAAKPEGNLLRVVADGESLTEGTVRQLKDVLEGLVVLAQMGLNEPKTSAQLDPQLRESYMELLQSVDIQTLDRTSSKSVRVVFDVTAKLLESAGRPTSAADPPPSLAGKPQKHTK